MWLLKTEPSVYSYADLEREGKTAWDGVTNPVALKNLRAMQAGDRVFVYHTGDEKAAVGIAESCGQFTRIRKEATRSWWWSTSGPWSASAGRSPWPRSRLSPPSHRARS